MKRLAALLLPLLAATPAAAKPLKIFILAGQSNMEGHAKVETFDHIGDDPATAPLLKQMRGGDGRPRVCDQVWISYLTGIGGANGEGHGKLTAGFGSRQKPEADGGKIGPEFTFGLTMDAALEEPVLIIKTAWGGKSLYHDFRPPCAGVYQRTAQDIEKQRHLEKDSGHYYRLMIGHVRQVLGDIPRVCPAYDPKQGFEIGGFVWLQGFNDMVSREVYPIPNKDAKGPRYADYSRWLASFIRDVRKDLNVPKMPFVIGVMGIGGAKPNEHIAAFREAMAAPAALPEFQGNVIAVETAPFWSEELGAIDLKRDQVRQMAYELKTKSKRHANADGSMSEQQQRDYVKEFEAKLISPAEQALWKRGASNAGYHYLGCAKTFALMGRAFAEALLQQKPVQQKPYSAASTSSVRQAEMAGYLFGPVQKVPEEFNAGFSLYAAAWPLLATYPGHKFQTGLWGTWMHPQYEKGHEPAIKCYTDIEGGLGWWRDTRFPTTTPKFIMGGVGPNFSMIANGPGYGAGTWEKPRGLYGVAQLSPWLLFPLDGLNLKQGTCGELFGYGYLPLPLTKAKATTAGKNVPTGDQCWTLFLNTQNFKGPAAFFTPYFWSQSAAEKPEFTGLLLDTRPTLPNKPFQMETQYVPAVQAMDAKGETYARVAPTSFPIGPEGSSVVLHRITAYKRAALWDDVKAWFAGGTAASGVIKPEAAAVHAFGQGGGSNWKIYVPPTARDDKTPLDWKSFATSFVPEPVTFGYRWDEQRVRRQESPNGPLATLPEYYRLASDGKKPQWTVVAAEDVPPETGLAGVRFDRPAEKPPEPRTTPSEPDSCWKTPGPAAGPFQARLGDGSVVTYSWYRFADQPALLNADLTPEEREQMQAHAEKLHRAWTKERDYLAPPTVGKLASLDPALILTPPKGMEAGFVPIATRQELAGGSEDKK